MQKQSLSKDWQHYLPDSRTVSAKAESITSSYNLCCWCDATKRTWNYLNVRLNSTLPKMLASVFASHLPLTVMNFEIVVPCFESQSGFDHSHTDTRGEICVSGAPESTLSLLIFLHNTRNSCLLSWSQSMKVSTLLGIGWTFLEWQSVVVIACPNPLPETVSIPLMKHHP